MLLARENFDTHHDQKPDSLAKHLKLVFLLYSAIGAILIGVVVSWFGIKPLYNQLLEEQERSLRFAVVTRGMAIEQFLDRSRDVAMQITSRTKARLKLEAYNRKEVDLDNFVKFSKGILNDAVNKSEEVVGMVRLDINNNAAISVGKKIPQNYWPVPDVSNKKPLLAGPIELDGNNFIIVGAPILNRQSQRVGTDIVLFSLHSLSEIITDYKGLGETGESVLAKPSETGVKLFFPQRFTKPQSAELTLPDGNPISMAMKKAFTTMSGSIQEGSSTLAYGPINGGQWGLVVHMDSRELNANVNQQLRYVAISLFLVICIATLVVPFLLRPLTGKVILQTGELEQQISEKTHALKKELDEKAKTQKLLAQQKEELEKTNMELDQFAYIASHDLKAPLRAIANISHWLEEDLEDKLNEDNRENMTLLLGRVHRMESLIDGILQYSRAGRLSVPVEEVDVGIMIREIWDSLSGTANNKMTLKVVGELPVFFTTQIRLDQVFSNLISNAIKYHDKPEGKISVGCIDRNHFYEFFVSDDGPGIAPEFHERIFRLFQTLQSRDEFESTGIGLTVVKKLIEEESGSVWVESQPGEGTTFHFTWPKEVGSL